MLCDLLGASLPDNFDKLAPLEKSGVVVDMAEKVGVSRIMTAENLAFGGRRYTNSLLTSIYNIYEPK